MAKIGRNDPCPCGSGRKHKHCCLGNEPPIAPQDEATSEFVLDSPYRYDTHPWGQPLDDADLDGFSPFGEDVDETEPETPLDEALALMDKAYEMGGSEAIELAHRAIATSPDCVEAYLFLAETDAADPKVRLTYYERAMAAAERREPSIATDPGTILERLAGNRADYLDALKGLGVALGELGRHEEALERLEAAIALDADDLAGAREPLFAEYLIADRDADARRLLTVYPDAFAVSPHWMYGRALLSFRALGDTIFPRRALINAFATNAYVGSFLSGPNPMPLYAAHDDLMDYRTDAIEVAAWQRDAWERTPGALDWLRSIYEAGPDAKSDAVEGGDGPSHFLAELESVGYIRCPVCHTKTKPRKRQVVVSVEPDDLVIVRVGCRCCEICDLVSLLVRDLERAVAAAMKARGGPHDLDSVAVGIIDPAVAEQRPDGVDDRAWADQHLRRWREDVRLQPPGIDPPAFFGTSPFDDGEADAPTDGVIDAPFSVRSR